MKNYNDIPGAVSSTPFGVGFARAYTRVTLFGFRPDEGITFTFYIDSFTFCGLNFQFKTTNVKCRMEDHLHIFSDLHPTICLSDYIKNIKVSSNLWMRESGQFPKFAGWQERYAAFTYSINEKELIINYIKNQKEHHKHETFYDEFKRLLIENQIEFDERYLL